MSRLAKVLTSVALGSLLLLPSRADAVTLQEIVAMSRAGLGDEVLLALIEIDQQVYPVDPDTLKTLKDAGVSEKVILAVVKSGRVRPPVTAATEPAFAVPPAQPEPEPQVVVIERERPVIREVPVAVPVYVAVGVPRHDRRRDGRHDGHRVKPDEHRVRPAEPVYWGWGGKLRPDAWQPAPVKRDVKPEGSRR